MNTTSETLQITRQGAPAQGDAKAFTGDVRVELLFPSNETARAAAANVSFAPGARTAWHKHPLGQTLVVTQGRGFVQREDGPIQPIVAGDVVWIPADVTHWHGATPDSGMTHIAVQEQLNGKMVDWAQHVTDDEYHQQDARN